MDPLDRRSFLASMALAAFAGAAAAACAATPTGGGTRRRLLCFTKASGWEHDVVKRGPGGEPGLVERAVAGLGERHGFDVTCTKDGGVFTAERLAEYDAFFFYTSGDLTVAGTDGQPPMPATGKQALFDAVRNGKGFVGVHSASDTFHSQPDPSKLQNRARLRELDLVVDPFIRMLGGEFLSHGQPQDARMRIVNPDFPGMDAFGAETIERFGEWYSLINLNPDMHALAVLETRGMQGPDYQRGVYPVIWARREGSGRVFYSALGHFAEEWADAAFLDHLAGAMRWAFGDVQAEATPNLERVAPDYAELPPVS